MRRESDRDPTCSELVELVTEYLDGGLATGDAERFEGTSRSAPRASGTSSRCGAAIELTGSLRGRTWTPG